MNRMKPLILALIVILVGLVLISRVLENRRLATTEGGGIVSILGDDFDPGALESIRAYVGSKPDSTVELTRTADGWVVASAWDWPAKETSVTRLLDDLKGLKGERRSSSPDAFADYSIGDEAGMHLTGARTGGNEAFHLVVGEQGGGGGNFVRRADSDVVYFCRTQLRSTFGVWGDDPKPPENRRWIELQLLRLDRNAVDRIVLTTGAGTLTLEKEFAVATPPAGEPDESAGDTEAGEEAGDETASSPEPQIDRTSWTWKADAAGELDKMKTDAVLGALCSLYAAEAVDPAGVESYGLGEGARTAEIVMEDGTVHHVFFGSETEDGSKAYVIVDGGRPATIHKGSVDRIFPERSALNPEKKS